MRLFKVKNFYKWCKKNQISDQMLVSVVDEMLSGLIDADLGGNLYKKRIATKGKGKAGGSRIIIATKLEDKFFFLAGYNKNELDNISKDTEDSFKISSNTLLQLTDAKIERYITANKLFEVLYEPR